MPANPIVTFGFAAILLLAPWQSHAADPSAANMAAPDALAEGGVVVSGPGATATMSLATLTALPSVQLSVPAAPAGGAGSRMFQGPLLWTVLVHAGVVDPGKHQGDVRGTVLLTGRDGYTAILALGEVSPEFEAKQVIVALRMDGQPLEPGHLRIVVPGDKRGGRGVHDLASIALAASVPPQR